MSILKVRPVEKDWIIKENRKDRKNIEFSLRRKTKCRKISLKEALN